MKKAIALLLALVTLLSLTACAGKEDTASSALDQIKQKAETEMGMVPAQSSQIVEYENPDEGYVKQYEQIPESGIIASADNVQD